MGRAYLSPLSGSGQDGQNGDFLPLTIRAPPHYHYPAFCTSLLSSIVITTCVLHFTACLYLVQRVFNRDEGLAQQPSPVPVFPNA